MSLTTIIISILLLGILIWSFLDYQQWKALGKGGVPDNLIGWLMVTGTRPLKRNPLVTKFFEEDMGKDCDISILESLSKRAGDRPIIAKHPVPHRQLSQTGDESIKHNSTRNYFLVTRMTHEQTSFANRLRMGGLVGHEFYPKTNQ